MSNISKETAELAELAAKFFEGITSGRIPLKAAEEFVNSGRTDNAPGLPPVGSMRTLPCPKCGKDTPHVLTKELYDSAEPDGGNLLRWICHLCGRKGTPIVRIDGEVDNWRTTRRE